MNTHSSFFKRLKRKIREQKHKILFPIRHTLIQWRIDKVAQTLGLHTPMVIKYIDGGLASQMVMFAKGYSYAKDRNLPLRLDISWFKRSGKDICGQKNRLFLLFDAFPEIKKLYSDKIIETPALFDFLFSDNTPSEGIKPYIAPRSIYLKAYSGEYHSLINHLEELKPLFQFNLTLTKEEEALANDIRNGNSCAIHIRKGDFVGSMHDVCSDNYYLEAIKKMKNDIRDCVFYVFSNDEEYARNLTNKAEGNFVIISNRTEVQPTVDMWLISICKHAIISNSGFSLVPSILSYSPDKKVILPKYWHIHKGNVKTQHDYKMPGWTCIEP